MGVCFGRQCFAHAFGSSEDHIILGKKEVEVVKQKKVGEQSSVQLGPKQEGYRANSQRRDVNYSLSMAPPAATVIVMSAVWNCCIPTETWSNPFQNLPFRQGAMPMFQSKLVPTSHRRRTRFYFRSSLSNTHSTTMSTHHHNGDDYGDNTTNDTSTLRSTTVQPYAFTFQAHPEYISPTGFNVNYINTVQAMEDRGYITQQVSKEACEDARVNFGKVREDSLEAVIAVATALGWFQCGWCFSIV